MVAELKPSWRNATSGEASNPVAPAPVVQSWASPMFSADPLDSRVEKPGEDRMHNCHVEARFDLIGNVLRRQREFDSRKREQAEWLEKVRLHKQQRRGSSQSFGLLSGRENGEREGDQADALEPKRRRQAFVDLPKQQRLVKRKLLGESHIVLQGSVHGSGERRPYSVFEAMVERSEVEHMCSCLDLCVANTPATKKCFTCLKFDRHGKGNFCEECFAKRHPPNRIRHTWKHISEVDPPLKQDWKQHMQRLELQRRDIACKDLLERNVRQSLERAREATIDLKIPRQLTQAHHMYEKSRSTLEDIKGSLARAMLEEKAATMIQKFWKNESTRANFTNGVRQWKLQRAQNLAATVIQSTVRMHVSKKRVRHFLLANIEEFYDHATRSHYYYNIKTRRTSWTRPKLLEGFQLLTPQSRSKRGVLNSKLKDGRFKFAAQLTEEEAAKMVQSAFRTKRIRVRFKQVLLASYREIVNQTTGDRYYINLVTNKTTWEKPRMIRNCVIQPFDPKEKRGRVPKVFLWSRELAARTIQGFWRTRKARQRLQAICSSVYQQVWSKSAQAYFYYNIRTGTSQWLKPAFFTASATKPRVSIQVAKRRRSINHVWNMAEAATLLQSLWRQKKAMMVLIERCQDQFEKIYSPEDAAFFYYNKRLRRSSWHKPRIVGKHDIPELAQGEAEPCATPPRLPRRRAAAYKWGTEEAVLTLQAAARKFLARSKAVAMCHDRFKKVWLADENAFVFYDKQTRMMSFNKPHLFGRSEVVVRARAEPKRARKVGHKWTDEEAALALQAMWRRRVARNKILLMCSKKYEQVWSEEANAFYFYNKETGVSSWERPKVLKENERILEVVRQESHGAITMLKRKRSIGHIWTDEEAALVLQGMWRKRVARKLIRLMCSKTYEQVWSEEEQAFYFFNRATGISSWNRPKFLKEDEDLPGVTREETHGKITMLKRARSIGHIWSDEEAALVLQGMWRKRVARKCILQMCSKAYEQVWSEEDQAYFFYNKETGVSSWERPMLLKANETLPNTVRKESHGTITMLKRSRSIGHIWTDEEAALVLQGMWRKRVARKRILQMCSKTYEQVWSEEDQAFFFYNKDTGVSSWDRPVLLKEHETLPESARTSKDGAIPMLKRLRSIGHIWTDEEAALVLQGMWRKRVARKLILQMCSKTYEQVWSEEHQAFFFYNTETGTSSWERPLLLKEHEALPDSVSRESHGTVSVLKRLRSIGHIWTDEEAALVLQGMWRKRTARKLILQMCSRTYEQVWSEEHQTFFFYNKETGVSSWDRPVLLKAHETLHNIVRKESHGTIPVLKRLRSIGHLWANEEAALVLQSMWRKRVARKLIVKMCSTAYEQVWSEEHQAFFFYNTNTGESTWEKPKLLAETVFTEPEEEKPPPKMQMLRRLRSIGHIFTDEEAALILQCMWRRKVARDRIKQMCSSAYEQVWSESDQAYFFFNKLTGESSWNKPKLLAD